MMGIDENAIAKRIVEKAGNELATKFEAEFKKVENEFHRLANYINLLEKRVEILEKKVR